jgi:hypothetical protein
MFAPYSDSGSTEMNEDTFNMSLRKFLKTVGVTAQREIETAVRERLADGRLRGHESLPAEARVVLDGVELDFTIQGKIDLG